MPTHKDMAWSPPSYKETIKSKAKNAPITWILIAINVGIYLIGLFPKFDFFTTGALSLAAVQAGDWYRLLSSMFLHLNLGHLACNMWTLYSIGAAVEHRTHKSNYLLLYLGSGLCGSAAVLLWDMMRHTSELTVGASGAIFGLFGVLLAMTVKKENTGISTKTLLLDIVLMLIPGFVSRGISVSAHIGGLLGGFLLGLLLA